MGQGQSNTNHYVIYDSYFNSDEKLFFKVYPEEEVANQNLEITKTDIYSYQKKENYLLTAKIINELFFNSSIITQEESQFEVLTNIIIPKFSQCLLTNNPDIIDSKFIFQFYESINNLFLERHNNYLSNIEFSKIPQIPFSSNLTENYAVYSVDDFHQLFNSYINQHQNNCYLDFSFDLSSIKPDNILKLIEQNPLNENLLIESFYWSIFHSDLHLLLVSSHKIIELSEKEKRKSDENKIKLPKNIYAIFNQDFKLSNIQIKRELLEGYISYTQTKFGLNQTKSKSCIFGVSPLYLFCYDNNSLHKIKLSSNNTTKEQQHFEVIPLKLESFFRKLFQRIDYYLTMVDNIVLIFNNNSKYLLFDYNSKQGNEFISIKQESHSPQLSPQTASDGHFIYSIINNKEIGVFHLNRPSNELKFDYSIQISYDKKKLEKPFNDHIFSTDLLNNSSIVTNGLVLEMILPEKIEMNKVVHFVRVISLLNGNHIHDYRFELPYPVNSIAFEPLTRSLWVLSVHNEGSCFEHFKYTGPDPLWLSGVRPSCTFPKMKDIKTFSKFKKFSSNYCLSIFGQFYGCDYHFDDFIFKYFNGELNENLFDLIFSYLSSKDASLKVDYIQFLFVILSFILRYTKMTKEQTNSLYQILFDYISNPNLYNFLTLFIIQITDNIESSFISKYFGLIFQHFEDNNIDDIFVLLSLLSRLENSKKFPYVLYSNCPSFINRLLSKLVNEKISEIETNFLLTYQRSIFSHYSRIIQKNPLKKSSIENTVFGFTQHFIENAVDFLFNIKSIETFQKSSFITVFKKLLIFLRLTTNSPTFVWPLLPNLLELLKTFPTKKFFQTDTKNPFYLFYMDIFFLYVYSFKQMLSFTDKEFLNKHSQFLNIKIESEKTVSEVFDNKLNDNDFVEVIKTLYQKVPNLLNKRLTEEDKETEKYMFLALIYKTQTTQEIIDISSKIKNKETIQLLPLIKQITQTVYSIRSNLRSKRQGEDKSEYNKLHKTIVDKIHFLLTFSSEKTELKSISSFINSNIQVGEIILAQSKLESVKQSFSFFIQYADSFITQKLPISSIYLFIMHISDNADIIDAYELVKKFIKIDRKYSDQFISNVLQRVGQIPPNPILSFLCNLIIILTKSYQEEEIHELIYQSINKIIIKFIKESTKLENVVFKSCIALICHFHRILNDEKYFVTKKNEIDDLARFFQHFPAKNSMSFTLEHSLYQGMFNHPKNFNLIKSIVGYVGQPKFHNMSLLLYDQLQLFSRNNQENEFMSILAEILDIIGTVLSGANSEHLLQIATPITKLNQSPDIRYCRTPTSQISCALELIQIIRRLIYDKESNSIQMIVRHFNYISDNFDLNNRKYIKQLFAMLAIMSNIIEIKRPFTIVTNNQNKSYFITSFDEQKNKLQGLLLPITTNQVIKHSLNNSDDLKSFELIPFKLSMLSDFNVPYSLFEPATNIEMKQYSDCLYTFYALQCVKENILDPEKGAEFSDIFFSKMKNTTINHFMFRNNAPLILSLLKKSITTETDGIFVGSPVKPQLFHASFTQLVFEDDYTLTENMLEAFTTPHVFISSIIDDIHPIYFRINFENSRQQFDFGVITHSVDQNQSISITYSTQESGFCVNGEKVAEYQIQDDTLIECRYHPAKNKVSFADSKNFSRIFSCNLFSKSQCSFIVLIHQGTRINYSCTFKPETDCFQKNLHLKQIVHPVKLWRKVKSKISNLKEKQIDEHATKFSMMIQQDNDDEREDIVLYKKAIKQIQTNGLALVSQNQDMNLDQFFTFAQFNNLRETALLLSVYPNASFSSNLNTYSSPIQLTNYVQVHQVSGRFDLIPAEKAMIDNENVIPPFHFQKYHHLPIEVINCYFSGVCEFHRQEILTLLAARVLSNSNDVCSSLNQFSITNKMLVNFVTSILLLLEPIRLSNLNEGKSPIEFESFNGFETCVKTDLYDYYSGLTKIVNHLQENGKKEFINEWFNKLENDFKNKSMHFATKRNTNLITVRSLIIDSYQNFNLEDVSGWIIFPYKFGCYNMPSIRVNHLIFPKSFTDNVNYSCSEGKTLRIMANYRHYSRYNNNNNNNNNDDELIAFGILPFFNKSNESLFYSFYHLAISMKYFVLFSQRDLEDEMKLKLRKLVFDSIVAGSPFFYSHSDTVLPFLTSRHYIPFTQEYVSMLNIFIFSTSHLKQNGIIQFVTQQMSLFEDLKAKELKYFISDSEPVPQNIVLPNFAIPQSMTNSTVQKNSIFVICSRVLMPNTDTASQFPFHLILSEWSEAFQLHPPCDLSFVESNVVSVTFTAYIPKSFELCDIDIDGREEVHVSYTGNFDGSYKKMTANNVKTDIKSNLTYLLVTPSTTNNRIFIKFPHYENLSQHNFVVHTSCFENKKQIAAQLTYDCRSFFSIDLNEWCQNYSADDDQQILKTVPLSFFVDSTILTRPSLSIICSLNNMNHRAHMNYLRAIYLIAFNYLIVNDVSLMDVLGDDNLKRFLSLHFLSTKFMEEVDNHCTSSVESLKIDRQSGLDVRNGISSDISKSLIGQFTKVYMKRPNNFRNKERPFSVRYLNERGIDAGGLMRDFSSELIADIIEPRIGLFIRTPNGRNHEGKYQECIVPSPAPIISKSDRYYQAIGALIAMGLRSGMKQPDLLFPPLFWKFLIDGRLKIEDVYEIDKSYKVLTSNLLRAANEMTDEEFENSMSSVSVLNLRGNQITFDRRSGFSSNLRNLSRSNCERFIAVCNESRLNELEIPLERVRYGFWNNLNFNPPPFATPSLIEYLACGERIITVNDLKRVTTFSGVSLLQKRYFWEVVQRMTNEERKKLLHFATGLTSISNEGLRVDSMGFTVDRYLPTASTCFFNLHLPSFSSSENMYRAFQMAINETGTFENS
ncbi:hypothetical protein M9Y10_023451 [Tritrichomonas musculus]|uniref:HECT domain-containing protein n=1 Tax=Tritrichomonas musculus TaxID=1915356 RepID=A0ABR2KV52_9EUKA